SVPHAGAAPRRIENLTLSKDQCMQDPSERGHRSGVDQQLNSAEAQSLHSSEVRLVSVNVGLPQVIGANRWGKPIRSGIAKRPVTAASISLDTLNLDGDRQADLSVHGGRDKAVYAYPAEHLPLWNGELGTDFGPGT